MTNLVPVPCIAPDKIYKYRRAQPLAGAEAVTYMGREVREVEGEGIFTYYHGIDIPTVGVSPFYQDFPTAMAEVDKVKRVLREYLKNPFIVFRLEKMLVGFNGFADKCLMQWYLDEKYWAPTTRQVYRFVFTFLYEIGIGLEISNKTAEIAANLFERDNAYSRRLNDLTSMTTKEAMIAHFPKEVKRLLAINAERENTGDVNGKFKNIYWLIRAAYLIPKYKRAIFNGLKAVEWEKWQLTESEIFHTLVWKDYNVQGRNYEERMAYYDSIFRGKKKPQQIMTRLK